MDGWNAPRAAADAESKEMKKEIRDIHLNNSARRKKSKSSTRTTTTKTERMQAR